MTIYGATAGNEISVYDNPSCIFDDLDDFTNICVKEDIENINQLLIGTFETSYEDFFKDNDRIYRVALNRIYPGREKNFGTSPFGILRMHNE